MRFPQRPPQFEPWSSSRRGIRRPRYTCSPQAIACIERRKVDVSHLVGKDRTVATPEPIEPSRRLALAAAAQRSRLENELEALENQAAALRRRVATAETRAAAIRQRLQLLDQLGNEARTPGTVARPRLVPPTTEPANGWLRGAAIRQVAVRLLAGSSGPTQRIHYTDWLDLLRDAGYGIQARDPAATFLTQLSRSPVVMRAVQPGTYVLDFAATARLRERLIALNEELLALHGGQQMIEQIASARDLRRELIVEIARVERSLEEAIGAIGADDAVTQTKQL
jgi:hypothetical protein